MLTYKYDTNHIFYVLIALGLVAVLFTNPFLKYPYDAIAHLISIDELYHDMPSTTSIPYERLIWHRFWAELFTVFHIDSSEFILRAKIIHTIQTYIAFFSLYYFSKVIFRNIFRDIPLTTLRYLSLWSVVIWLSIFATFSVNYQLIWSFWYSVNYQITLPLFWYITALTLVLFLEETSLKKKIFFIIQILLISAFTLRVHSMEFMYYLMYMFIFSLIYLDKVYLLIKKYYYIFIVLGIALFYAASNYVPDTSKIFNYFTLEKFPHLYDQIMLNGNYVLTRLNRSSSAINELMVFIYIIGIGTVLLFLWHRYNQKSTINTRLFLLIIITSLFILIPLFEFSAGLFSIITRATVIHRIYYSSSLFILLPVFLYYIAQSYQIKVKYVHILLLLSLVFVYVFSKHNDRLSHSYYKNIQSIKNSFYPEKVGFNLSEQQIDLIGKTLDRHALKNRSSKIEYYYARADISFVIKYIYGKKVFWKGRRASPNYKKFYEKHQKNNTNKKYYRILFETPETFPQYIPYK